MTAAPGFRSLAILPLALASLTFSAGAAPPSAPLPALAPLTPGAIAEGDLAGGEVRDYTIELPAGTWFAASFDQQGIDLRPAVLGPDGATLFELDTREWGLEPVRFIAPVSGSYTLEARTLHSGRVALRTAVVPTTERSPRSCARRARAAPRGPSPATRP